MQSLKQQIELEWLAADSTRSAPVYSELQEITLAAQEGRFEALERETQKLARALERKDREIESLRLALRRIDPERRGETILGSGV